MAIRRHPAAMLLIAALLGALLSLAPPQPEAEAQACVAQTAIATQTQMAAEPNGCRFMVADPGQGTILNGDAGDRSGILRADRKQVYLDNGFTENFLWYAEQKPLTFTQANDQLWTGCNQASNPSTACPSVGTSGTNGPFSIFSTFQGAKTANGGSGSVTLDVFEFGAMWIARVCGNWHNIAARPNPVPSIPIEKYNDANRDGNRSSGEGPVAGVEFKIRRVSSRVGQGPGLVGTVVTNGGGTAAFALDGHGPGRYTITETVPSGTFATTPTVRTVDVDFGIRDTALPVQRFGNAPSTVDVAKTQFEVTLPDNFEARTDGDVTVDLTITNNGPADHVPVTDEVLVNGPADCSIVPARREFSAVLRVGQSASRSFTFAVNCDRPSFHEFTFDDLLTVDDGRLTETNVANNTASRARTRPVHAYTDLSTQTSASCPSTTEVGMAITCSIAVDVANNGYGPIDATVGVDLAQTIGNNNDCTIEPSVLQYQVASLGDAEARTLGTDVVVTCSHRSDHQIQASSSVVADDIHVFETDPSSNSSIAIADFEVFHDAALTADNIQTFCNEQIGVVDFTCVVEIDVSNAGPAPDVNTTVSTSIEGFGDCSVLPGLAQSTDVVLAIGMPQTVEFTWQLSCTDGSMLHPFRITADVAPASDEPHAVDIPGPITDDWIVPYCMETVNPSGNNVPAAPGNGGQGQNQDGFYTFGAKTIDGDADVWIEDDGTGTVWGPFESGVRVKYTEANGANPSITPMGGNNGNGSGSGNGGNSVDYQIRGQGDAVAVHYDEDGNVIRTTCLVPPFPQ